MSRLAPLAGGDGRPPADCCPSGRRCEQLVQAPSRLIDSRSGAGRTASNAIDSGRGSLPERRARASANVIETAITPEFSERTTPLPPRRGSREPIDMLELRPPRSGDWLPSGKP
jgi:hypothetical protein